MDKENITIKPVCVSFVVTFWSFYATFWIISSVHKLSNISLDLYDKVKNSYDMNSNTNR